MKAEEGLAWRQWGTTKIAIAEYAANGVVALVTCVEGTHANWLVRVGESRIAEGMKHGEGAFEEAVREAEKVVGLIGLADRSHVAIMPQRQGRAG